MYIVVIRYRVDYLSSVGDLKGKISVNFWHWPWQAVKTLGRDCVNTDFDVTWVVDEG